MSLASDTSDELPLLIADIFEAAGSLRRRGDRIAAVAGQTQARWQLLSVVSEGEWTVPRAARRLGITRQGVQRIADALRADGLLVMERNPDHRRSPLLHLTEPGRQTLATITAEARRWHEHAAALFASAQLDLASLNPLRRALRALTDAAD